MSVTEFPIVTSVRFEQKENTLPPIVFTELGMTMDVKPEQL